MTTVSGTRAARSSLSGGLGVDFLVEVVLGQEVQLAVLLLHTVSADELELLERKLVKLVLQLPDGRLLQPSDGLLSEWLLLAGFPQVGFFPFG